MQTRTIIVAAVAVLLAAAAVQAAITIETVHVGDPGNAVDPRYAAPNYPYYGNGVGFGAVAYEYNIGKYEVTAGQYTEFLNNKAKCDSDPYGLYNTFMTGSDGCKIQRTGGGTVANPYVYTVASDWANRPVNFVSFGDAARFTNWLHNGQGNGSTEDGAYYLNGATTNAQLQAVSRESSAKWAVTSEDEWYKAAYYKGGGDNAGYWKYPAASDATPGRDMDDASGNNANYYDADTYLIGSPYYRTPVGEFQNSDSPYGTFDQGGNVWEWNETNLSGSNRGMRGGSFLDNHGGYGSGDLSASYRNSGYEQAAEYHTIGFRVSEIPEPATLSLLALGAMAMLRRRK